MNPPGEGGWLEDWWRKYGTYKGPPTGVDRDASNVEGGKWGRPDRGRGGRNRLAEQGYMVRPGPGGKVKGGKTASAGMGGRDRWELTLVQVNRQAKTGRGGING